MSRVRIHWRHRRSGATGRGEPIQEDIARAWIDHVHKNHLDVDHWTEPVADEPATTDPTPQDKEPLSP